MLNCIHMYQLLIDRMLIYIRNDIEMPLKYYLPYISHDICAIKKLLQNGVDFFLITI